MLIIVPRYSAEMGLPDERCVPLNGNHLEIAKYLSREDNNFKTVAGRITVLIQSIEGRQASELANP
jgi:hypothetical protein